MRDNNSIIFSCWCSALHFAQGTLGDPLTAVFVACLCRSRLAMFWFVWLALAPTTDRCQAERSQSCCSYWSLRWLIQSTIGGYLRCQEARCLFSCRPCYTGSGISCRRTKMVTSCGCSVILSTRRFHFQHVFAVLYSIM